MIVENFPVHIEIISRNSIIHDTKILIQLEFKKLVVRIYEAYLNVKVKAARIKVLEDVHNIMFSMKSFLNNFNCLT